MSHEGVALQMIDKAEAHCRCGDNETEKPVAAAGGVSGEPREKYTDEQLAALHDMYYGPDGICRYSDSLEGWR